MIIKKNDFFSISNQIDRKEFIQKYFSNIKDSGILIDNFYVNSWYNYQLSNIYNFLSDNYSHKFLIVRFEEEDNKDDVLVSIKFVTNFKNVYIRIQHYPKSIMNNIENEKAVFNFLKTFSYIQLLWENEANIQKYNFEWNKRIVDINFYDIVPQRWEYMNRKDFLKKRKINRFLKDDSFYLTNASILDLDSVKECFNEWSEWIKEHKGLHNKKLFENIFKQWDYLVNDSDNIEVLLMKYNNVVIGCSIYVKMGNSYQNIAEFSRTIRNCKMEVNDKRFKTYLQGSAQIMNYFHMRFFLKKGVDIISYAGSIEKSGSLYKHKVNNYSKKECYYSTNLN
jgi:hypothetical protein